MGETHLRLVGAEEAAAEADALDDDDLMRLARAGRQDAFERLVRRHQALVLGLATRWLSDPAEGRDVAQDVFLALWAERDRYRPNGRFRSYLVSMTCNRCRVAARQRRSHGRKVSGLAAQGPAAPADPGAPLERLVEAERAREVRRLLGALPEKTREVVILRFTHELPLADIAELTGLPLNTVKSHVHRGLERLHALLTGDPR